MLRFPHSPIELAGRPLRTRHVVVASACLALVAACSADKNKAQRLQAWEEQRAAAKDAGAIDLPLPEDKVGERVLDGEPHQCIRSCIPDPAPPLVDCAAAESRYEFFSPPIWSFETTSENIYSYDDYSVAAVQTRAGGGLDREFAMQRCSNPAQPSNKVLHLWGGPYLAWGGGVLTSMKDWWTRNGGSAQPCTGPGTPTPCESLPASFGLKGKTVDLSQWDGVSLWARRGPESQAGIRVMVGDKSTDDDLNIEQNAGDPNADDHVNTEQTYCKRARRCDCSGNSPCSLADNGGMYCFDPSYQPQPGNDRDYQRCGKTACDADYEAGGDDKAFEGRECTPFQLQSGYTRSYCFNPGQDPEPAENTELCGDHFQTPIRLSTEWQFFLVPFSGMRQQAYGKESPGLSTDQISVVRLTFEPGWIDYYVDDVRFYRLKR
ncbi:MAG: hypothetical protein ACOY0T_11970 [Myxococcota bacterium]